MNEDHITYKSCWFTDACCEINRVMVDEEFVDNYRCYRKKDNFGRKEYDEALSEGCCGSADWEYTDKSGDVWVIGCNYGH